MLQLRPSLRFATIIAQRQSNQIIHHPSLQRPATSRLVSTVQQVEDWEMERNESIIRAIEKVSFPELSIHLVWCNCIVTVFFAWIRSQDFVANGLFLVRCAWFRMKTSTTQWPMPLHSLTRIRHSHPSRNTQMRGCKNSYEIRLSFTNRHQKR